MKIESSPIAFESNPVILGYTNDLSCLYFDVSGNALATL